MKRLCAAAALYTAVSVVWFIIPLKGGLSRGVLGSALFEHDSVLNAGVLEWGYRALPSPALHVFDWTAGFPYPNTLAGTENILGWQLLYAPLRAAGMTVAGGYSLVIVLSLILSALGACLLARQLGADDGGAFIAGFVFAFVGFHLNHVFHLQTLSATWTPWAIWFLDRYLDRGRLSDASGAGAFFTVCVASGLYIGAFLALVMPLYAALALALGRYPVDRKRLAVLAVVGACTLIPLWPIVTHHLAYARAHSYRHPLDELLRFSAEVTAVIKVPAWQAMWANSGYAGLSTHWSAAFPGFVALALGVYGLRSGKTARLLLFLCIACFLISLGPRLMIRQHTPVPYAQFLPLPGRLFEIWSVIRWPMRILFFCFLGWSALAGLGFTAAVRNWPSRARWLAAAGVSLMLYFEYRPLDRYAGDSVTIPEPLAYSDAYPFLAAETDRGGVVELPAMDATGYRTPMLAKSIYGSAGHLRRVVAFLGSIKPPLTIALLEAAERAPAPGSIDLLRRNGCTRLVVHRAWNPRDTLDEKIRALREAGLPVLHESTESVVFSLSPHKPA